MKKTTKPRRISDVDLVMMTARAKQAAKDFARLKRAWNAMPVDTDDSTVNETKRLYAVIELYPNATDITEH